MCAGILALGIAAASERVEARVLLTQEQALEGAFGHGAGVERVAVYLTDAQRRRASELAGPDVKIEVGFVARYVGSKDGRPLGVAYFDTHLVRTLPETILVVVSPDGSVDRVEILSFAEPEEYLPRKRWTDLFHGKKLDDDLRLRRGVHGISGATLSAEAATQAVRRVLALHRAIEETAPR